MEWENLEQVARALGERWARRLRTKSAGVPETSTPWPCTLDEARKLLDEVVGDKMPRERREPLSLILERSARAAWFASAQVTRLHRKWSI